MIIDRNLVGLIEIGMDGERDRVGLDEVRDERG